MKNFIKVYENLCEEQYTVPERLQQSVIPSLDGLRALSILLVIGYHLKYVTFFDNKVCEFLLNGSLGVNVFFVISGFLITTLLLKEKAKNSTISLKNFYIRRFLRIFPVAYLYLVVVFVLDAIFFLNVHPIAILASALYISNFSYFGINYPNWHTGHFWSLSIEEQFYIVFPFILKTRLKYFVHVILVIIVVIPLLIMGQLLFPVIDNKILHAITFYFVKFQSIAVGCLFALIYFKEILVFEKFIQWRSSLNILLLFVIFFCQHTRYITPVSVFTNLLTAVATGIFICYNLHARQDFSFRLLNSKVAKRIGILSYSLYIWQQLFTASGSSVPLLYQFPLNILLLIVAACCSYYFFEKRFLSLKEKFTPKHNDINTRLPTTRIIGRKTIFHNKSPL